jgi:hypothetical protein
MADVEKLIKKCRTGSLKMRPVLPLGQAMALGMVGVLDGGAFRYRGSVNTMLGEAPGRPLPGQGQPSVELTSGKDVSLSALAKGETSGTFGEIAKARARIEITLNSKNSFLVAARDIEILTLREPERFLAAMLRAYGAGLWLKNYCFVYQIGVVSSFQAVLSHQTGAKLLLSVAGALEQGPLSLGSLAIKPRYERQRGEVEQLIANKSIVAFYNAYCVKDPLFRAASVKVASALGPDTSPDDVRAALKVRSSPYVRV